MGNDTTPDVANEVGATFRNYAESDTTSEITATRNASGSWDVIIVDKLPNVSKEEVEKRANASAADGAFEITATRNASGSWDVISRFKE